MVTTQQSAETVNQNDVKRSLELFQTDGGVVEIRGLQAYDRKPEFKVTRTGYFDRDHVAEAVQAVCSIVNAWHASGVYITLNPVMPALLARSANKVKTAPKGESTKDTEITAIRWILIDFDPVRPAGISSSDEELGFAAEKAKEVKRYLEQAGFAPPIIAMSGNGFHLLYEVKLPVEDSALVARLLKALDQMFSDDKVKIDTSVFNPSRITKLYGTIARKGDSTPDRPHRISKLAKVPESINITLRTAIAVVAQQYVPLIAQGRSIPQQSNSAACSAMNRARAYLAQIPGAISGDKGHTHTFTTALKLVAFGLSFEEVFDLLSAWSKTCVPPWSDSELRHKIEGAFKANPTPMPERQPASATATRLDAGTRVRCRDRDNFGEVVSDNGGPDVLVHFVSPEGVEATVDIPRHQLADADGRPVVPSGFQLNLIPSRVFATADYQQRFLIKHVLVANQPCIMGGPHKGLKTGTLLELAISLGAGRPFLNKPEFAVLEPVDVMVLSGESGMATLQETARRIAFAKEVDLAETRIWWEDTLPKIANPEHLDALREAIVKSKSKACLIDPAYLCLLSGDTKGRQASNVFDMGTILTGLGDVGRDTECCMVLAHHMRKNPAEPFAIPKLEELAYAGFSEFARQWILLNRRSEYRDDGRHELWLSIGGSAGHSSTWAYNVEEGVPDEHFRGRYWDVTVTPAKEAIEGKKRDKERQKENDRHSRLMENVERIMDFLRDSDQPQNKTNIKANCGLSGTNFPTAWAAILKRKVLTVTREKGENGRPCEYFSITAGQQDAAGLLRECPAVPTQEHSNRTGAL